MSPDFLGQGHQLGNDVVLQVAVASKTICSSFRLPAVFVFEFSRTATVRERLGSPNEAAS